MPINRKKIYVIVLILLSIAAAFFQYQKLKFDNDYIAYMGKIAELDKINSQRYADLRDAENKNDLNKCLELKSLQKNACLLSYSLRNNDLSACKMIAVDIDAKNCEDMVNTAMLSKNDQNLSKCSTLNSETNIAICYQTYISRWLSTNDSEKCQLTELPSIYQKHCQDRFALVKAVTNKKESDCEEISDAILLTECKKNIKSLPNDKDQDGLPDMEEKSYGTDFSTPDSDGDNLSDGDEIYKYSTNPLSKDSDKDTLTDNNEMFMGTIPNNIDTDADGYTDGAEISKSFNPCGDGNLPDKEELLRACEKYKK